MNYSTDLFDAATVERMAEHLGNLLAAACEAPATPLSQLSLMGPAEMQLTLRTFNDTAAAYAHDGTVHQLFESAVARTPQAACLVTSGGEQLTYAAVNAAANQLAHWLVRRGVAAGAAVGVSLPKCPRLYIALLAVLKTGGAYVPLDPGLPAERATYMLQQTGVQLLLAASESDTAQLPGVEVVVVDGDWRQFASEPQSNPRARAGPSDVCYCIFTSGSTGQPKVCVA